MTKCSIFTGGVDHVEEELVALVLVQEAGGLRLHRDAALPLHLETVQNLSSRAVTMLLFQLWPASYLLILWRHINGSHGLQNSVGESAFTMVNVCYY